MTRVGSQRHRGGKKLVKCYTWSTAFYGAENCELWVVNQKYLESFEMRCCRRMEKTSSSYRVKNKYYKESWRREISYI
jgi:hypothetical protein